MNPGSVPRNPCAFQFRRIVFIIFMEIFSMFNAVNVSLTYARRARKRARPARKRNDRSRVGSVPGPNLRPFRRSRQTGNSAADAGIKYQERENRQASAQNSTSRLKHEVRSHWYPRRALRFSFTPSHLSLFYAVYIIGSV